MNIILFITIIVLILIFGYQIVMVSYVSKGFKLDLDITWVDERKSSIKRVAYGSKRS